jgi:hypothetical protein
MFTNDVREHVRARKRAKQVRFRHRDTGAIVMREGMDERRVLFRRSDEGEMMQVRRDCWDRDYIPEGR